MPTLLDHQNEKEAGQNKALISTVIFAKMNITVICGPPVLYLVDLIAEVLVDDWNVDELQQATKYVRAIYTYGVGMSFPVQDRLFQLFPSGRIINGYGIWIN